MLSILKKLRLPLMLVGLLISVSLIVYPLFANWYYEHTCSTVITEYQEAQDNDALSDVKATALHEAMAYNASLGSSIIADPFVDADNDSYAEISGILDIAGNGVLAYVEIPKISVFLPVYYGTDDKTLEKGIGVVEGTSLPVGGETTHSIIAGHSGISTARLFSDLDLLELGDLFYIHVLDRTLVYQVDQIVTVLPTDVSQIGITPGEDYCTLLTCTPYGINTHRLLVRGIRIKNAGASIPSVPAESMPGVMPGGQGSMWEKTYFQAIILGLSGYFVLLIVILIFWHLRKKHRKGREKR